MDPGSQNSPAFRHIDVMAMLGEANINPVVVAQLAVIAAKTIYSNYASLVSIEIQRRAKGGSTGGF